MKLEKHSTEGKIYVYLGTRMFQEGEGLTAKEAKQIALELNKFAEEILAEEKDPNVAGKVGMICPHCKREIKEIDKFSHTGTGTIGYIRYKCKDIMPSERRVRCNHPVRILMYAPGTYYECLVCGALNIGSGCEGDVCNAIPKEK